MGLFKEIARSTAFVPGQLRRLYKSPKRSSEFELAFAEFHDNIKHEKIVNNLHGARLQDFVDFLDEVREHQQIVESPISPCSTGDRGASPTGGYNEL